jgi:serine/threonine protein kinase
MDSPEELDALVFEALERIDAEGDAALDELCAAHPHMAEALRRRIGLLRDVRSMMPDAASETPDRLGQFRLLRQLGAGGMGVVYLAEQEPLGREVALKLIRPERLFFPGARERFRREVETVARLQHPSIAPIYTVGEEQGLPYFAMEFVRGESLDRALRRLAGRNLEELRGTDLAPDAENAGYLYAGTWEQACLRVVARIADALEHAHQRGVVHRDVKPSNVMLTADGTSRVLLLDFGIASSTDKAKLTQTGSQVGSLLYMAPEQLPGAAARVGPRTDVYGLGLILYELLTLKCALRERGSSTSLLEIESVEPAPLRALNPRVSWEAEAVCATAMERAAERRYATAADFLRDLVNALEKRPIEARRVRWARRARRWVERHPARAALLSLSIAGPLVYAWQARHAAHAIGAQRDRAEHHFDRALAAVDRMLTRVGNVDLRFMPLMEPVRRGVLEDAVALLQEFVNAEHGDPRAVAEVARAEGRLGTLLFDLGRHAEGLDSYRRSLDGLERLRTARGDDVELEREIAAARIEAVGAMTLAGQLDAAREQQALCAKRLDAALARRPDDAELAVLAAGCDRMRASLEVAEGNYEEGRRSYEETLARIEALEPRAGALREFADLRFATWNHYGLLLIERFTAEGERNQAALDALEKSVEHGAALAALEPRDPQPRRELATARINLAGAERRAQDFERARELYVATRDELSELVREFPEMLDLELELATCHNQLGLLCEVERKFEECGEHYEPTVELLRDLVSRAPREPMLLNRLATAELNLSTYPHKLHGELAQAEELALSSVGHQRVAVELAPDQASYREALFHETAGLEYLRRLRGDHRGAVAAASELPGILPREFEAWRRAAYSCTECMKIARDAPDLEEDERAKLVDDYVARAVEYLRQGMALHPKLRKPLREFADFEPLHGTEPFEALLVELER